MYREYITRFILAGMVLVSSCVCVRELKINRIAAKPAFQMEYLSDSMTEDKQSFMEMISTVSSGQRVVDYEVLEQTMQYQLSDKDLDALHRIVEAEAGGECGFKQSEQRSFSGYGVGGRDAERAGCRAVFPYRGRQIPERSCQ